jgi:hypothetical protein
MANTDNKCHQLPLDLTITPTFTEMLAMQKSLQERVMGPDFYSPYNSIGHVAEFFVSNAHALNDEIHETIDAVGGIGKGFGSAAWKWWKKDYAQAQTTPLSDMHPEDLLELKYEIVDQFHFFMNQMVKIGMTADELASMYVAKNKENFDRQERGY